MLYITPEALNILRSAQGKYIAKLLRRKTPPARPRKLNRDRRRQLINRVARFMSIEKGEGRVATLFAYEGTIRHSLRSSLCLKGWKWAEADAAAVDVVQAALRQAGAQRPRWEEGQPEWAQQGAGTLIERTRCVQCHRALPEGHRKFCSDVCNVTHHTRIYALQGAREAEAYDKAVRGWYLDHDRA